MWRTGSEVGHQKEEHTEEVTETRHEDGGDTFRHWEHIFTDQLKQ